MKSRCSASFLKNPPYFRGATKLYRPRKSSVIVKDPIAANPPPTMPPACSDPSIMVCDDDKDYALLRQAGTNNHVKQSPNTGDAERDVGGTCVDEGALLAGYEAACHGACDAHQLAHQGLQAEQACMPLPDVSHRQRCPCARGSPCPITYFRDIDSPGKKLLRAGPLSLGCMRNTLAEPAWLLRIVVTWLEAQA